MKVRNTFATNLLQYVRDKPGVTGPQIHDHFKLEAKKTAISSSLGRLRRMGMITNNGSRGPRTQWYPVKFDIPDPKFVDKAQILLYEMAKIPKSERETFLALYLQNM